ncbi:hypothetical protein F5144DRAFT_396759 [Chaetomium tenue]|uniref:Uncharacterized protein n=1 Tax=Chaetomium tenue TaxID=1854479 RepID=A0ACB7NXV7_9PEZI|nr:hypothetical protein F5144DRAFT_396759 [Chaetomium globosum]
MRCWSPTRHQICQKDVGCLFCRGLPVARFGHTLHTCVKMTNGEDHGWVMFWTVWLSNVKHASSVPGFLARWCRQTRKREVAFSIAQLRGETRPKRCFFGASLGNGRLTGSLPIFVGAGEPGVRPLLEGKQARSSRISRTPDPHCSRLSNKAWQGSRNRCNVQWWLRVAISCKFGGQKRNACPGPAQPALVVCCLVAESRLALEKCLCDPLREPGYRQLRLSRVAVRRVLPVVVGVVVALGGHASFPFSIGPTCWSCLLVLVGGFLWRGRGNWRGLGT